MTALLITVPLFVAPRPMLKEKLVPLANSVARLVIALLGIESTAIATVPVPMAAPVPLVTNRPGVPLMMLLDVVMPALPLALAIVTVPALVVNVMFEPGRN